MNELLSKFAYALYFAGVAGCWFRNSVKRWSVKEKLMFTRMNNWTHKWIFLDKFKVILSRAQPKLSWFVSKFTVLSVLLQQESHTHFLRVQFQRFDMRECIAIYRDTMSRTSSKSLHSLGSWCNNRQTIFRVSFFLLLPLEKAQMDFTYVCTSLAPLRSIIVSCRFAIRFAIVRRFVVRR